MENEEVVNEEVEETTEAVNEPDVEEKTTEEEVVENEQEEETQEEEEEEAQEEEELEETYTKSQVEKMLKKRLARAERSYKNKEQKFMQTLKAGGFEGESLEDLDNELRNSYKEQGIDVPEYVSDYGLSDREQAVLGESDAKEIIEMGDMAMEERFSELYEKQNRTLREEKEMEMIGREASLKNARKELVKLGLDPDEMLNNEEFLNFASEMSSDVPVSKIVKYYQKLNGTAPQKPKSTGSTKSKGGSAVVKDFYTPEEAKQFTRKQLDENPALFNAICDSMTKW